ncbi:hypothetical protein NHX12_013397 [Muraenolepis orangiensis]|uniref:Dishevelled n=1 Tax=Muraenolepis orangiensis TaxID=630683 RepID=A0A9Q0I815_9TELE|nr:hypothetical protein NHX12_013397 [Muraenolepis orangiensis]
MAETKIIYHIDEEETPYLVKLSVSPEKVTLADFKNVLNNRPVNSYKFFFKSMDQDFGSLPVSPWYTSLGLSIMCSVGDGLSDIPYLMASPQEEGREGVPRINGHAKSERTARDSAMGYDSASVMSSELESSSFVDSEEDEDASRLSSSTEQSSSSQLMRRHKRRRRRQKVAKIDRSSSFSSITDSTMSLNIITVTLNMEKYNFLGISIVGQSNDRGDGGIYIGSIMKGGAVAADGRIEPGDMLLQVNDVNFENMSNDDAVRILREIVSKTGPISLTVAKCWDPSPRSYFTIPRAEPVRPIDPAAWISHTTALTGPYPHYEFDDLPLSASKTDMATIVKVMQLPDSGLEIRDRMWLKITIANAIIGADVVDWLYSRVEGFKDRRDARKYASSLLKHGYLRHTVNKITFSEQCYYTFGDLCQNPCHSFHSGSAGSQHSEGSRSSGSNPSAGKVRRSSPQEKAQRSTCSESEPGVRAARRGGGSDRSASQTSHAHSHAHSHARSGLSHAPSHRSHPHSQHSHPSFTYSHGPPPPGPLSPTGPLGPPPGPGSCAHSDRSHASSYGPPGLPPPYCLARLAPKSPVGGGTPPGAPPGRELAIVPPELTASRQSFQHAMGNPCEFFVDIM